MPQLRSVGNTYVRIQGNKQSFVIHLLMLFWLLLLLFFVFVFFFLLCNEVKMTVLVAQPCLILYDLMDCSPPGSSVPGMFQTRIQEMGSHFLFQGIFPTQVVNPGLPHSRQILYCLSHQRSPLFYLNCSNIQTTYRQYTKPKMEDIGSFLNNSAITYSLILT